MMEKLSIKKNKFVRDGLYYFFITIICSVCIFYMYRLWKYDITVYPIGYANDAKLALAVMKVVEEWIGGGYVSKYLGAGINFHLYDFNTATFLFNIYKKLLCIITQNYILAHNLCYFSSFVFVGWSSFFVLKRMSIEKNLAMIISILYAFIPYHMYREQAHINLSFYVCVPLVIYYVLYFMQNEKKGMTSKEHIKFAVVMLFAGMSGFYYAFFACFFLAVGSLFCVLHKKFDFRNLLGIVYVIGGLLLGGLPSIIYWIQVGKNSVPQRGVTELSTFALQIPRLFMPISAHRIDFLAEWKDKYNQLYGRTESDFVALGVLFSIGLLLLIIELLMKKREKMFSSMHEIAVLNLAAIMYGVAGGFILLQGMFITNIRCTNRISIYIGFLCCIALGKAMTYLLDKIAACKFVKKYSYWKIAFLFLFFMVGFLDQTKSEPYIKEDAIEEIDEDSGFVQKIEEMESEGALIYQLPYEKFPESPVINRMEAYSQFVGYFFSNSLKWSYGANEGSVVDVSNRVIASSETVKDLVDRAVIFGYDGVFINRWGYKEEELEELESGLKQLLGINPVESCNNKYAYYTLKDYVRNNPEGVKDKRLAVGIEYSLGVYDEETNVNDHWRWLEKESEIKLINISNEPIGVDFEFIPVVDGREGKIEVRVGDEIYLLELNLMQKIKLILQPGVNSIYMKALSEPLDVEEDDRELYVRLHNYNFIIKPDVVDIEFGPGVYDEESNHNDHWRWLEKESEITLFNFLNEPVMVNFVYTPVSTDRDGKMEITVGETSYCQDVNTKQQMQLELQPGENRIYMNAVCEPECIPNDNRNLFAILHNYEVKTIR